MFAPDPVEFDRIRKKAIQIACEAGQVLLRGWGTRPEVSSKSVAIDLVTDFDRQAEAIVVPRLAAEFPSHAVVGEEGGNAGRADASRIWYVDPLDGTTNFTHGLPFFAVSLGMTENQEPAVGVVHAPALGWTFSGACGVGAFFNDKSIHVSGVTRIEEALLVTGFPYLPKTEHDNIPELTAFAAASRGVRRFGSAALDVSMVACGWLDGYWERHIQPWDLVGGAALVAAAGGRITDMDGSAFDGRTGRLLATNGLIHDQMRSVLERVAVHQGLAWP